ncbi:MAG: HPr family phosphocarrier protein [Anaerolineae bacterium]|nr:HPr family phosphocarrier protein [Anaerolineae bacterium]
MNEITLTIQHEVGLHARPAALFVKKAMEFQSAITVFCGDRKANAKSILNVLTLGANKGAQITVQADGSDSEAALAALQELVDSNFGGVA